MNDLTSIHNQLSFMVLPYLAILLFFLVGIYRYSARRFSYSSLSSQFLENQQHFWGLVPFHYGILVVLLGHLMAFLIPQQILLWNSHPLRLIILEISALIFGLLSIIGLLTAVARRLTNSRVKYVTSVTDWILLLLLLFQVLSGVYIAIFIPWGSSWFAASMTPYLRSLLQLNPNINYITGLPFMVKYHIINAFILIGFAPFTRLVHVLVMPTPYLWRKPQVVRWYQNRKLV